MSTWLKVKIAQQLWIVEAAACVPALLLQSSHFLLLVSWNPRGKVNVCRLLQTCCCCLNGLSQFVLESGSALPAALVAFNLTTTLLGPSRLLIVPQSLLQSWEAECSFFSCFFFTALFPPSSPLLWRHFLSLWALSIADIPRGEKQWHC